MAKRSKWFRIRKLAEAGKNVPVQVVKGNVSPTLMGEPGHYVTRTGKPVMYPRAYAKKGRVTYVCSTQEVIVGRDWLVENLTEEELMQTVLEVVEG